MTAAAQHTAHRSLAERAVDRVSRLLAGRRATRRQFLFRAAVVGSAMAVDPLGYILRPGTAYASVCGAASSCGAGWSAFCCTINGGANTCPHYAYVAGWWKVDASAFCLGAPRYYIDCNRRPNRSCSCRCASGGSCDRRRVCCNVFRYGQCNTHIPGVTQVVCRVVTCTPPWEWDRACGRTVRTSNATRSHTAPCLPGTSPTRIEIKYQDLGLVGSVLGSPDGRERDAARGGRKRPYARGMILWHRNHGAHEVHGPVARLYRASGAETGPLGYPRTDHRAVGDGSGQVVRFERGSIYRRFGGATRMVLTRADRRYRKLGGPRGRLGYPTSNTRAADAAGTMTRFQRGAIFMSTETDAVEVTGRILDVYSGLGGPGGSELGFPVSPARSLSDGTYRQRFQHGVVIGPNRRRVYAVHDVIRQRWMADAGGQSGPWGYPVDHTRPAAEVGRWTGFQHVVAYWSPRTGVHWIARGPLYRRYRVEGGAAGWLGFPVADQTTTPGGVLELRCEHGVITHDPRSDETTARAAVSGPAARSSAARARRRPPPRPPSR